MGKNMPDYPRSREKLTNYMRIKYQTQTVCRKTLVVASLLFLCRPRSGRCEATSFAIFGQLLSVVGLQRLLIPVVASRP